jgi:hypothetical protein
MAYYAFKDENGNDYGSFEVFYMDLPTACDWGAASQAAGNGPGNFEAGHYWIAGFPGCLPDGDLFGPFATEDEAIADALFG